LTEGVYFFSSQPNAVVYEIDVEITGGQGCGLAARSCPPAQCGHPRQQLDKASKPPESPLNGVLTECKVNWLIQTRA
jgi:hypothetical protein